MQQSDACGYATYSYSYNQSNGIVSITLGGSGSSYTWDYQNKAQITIIE